MVQNLCDLALAGEGARATPRRSGSEGFGQDGHTGW